MPAAAYARLEASSPMAGVLMVKQSESVAQVIDDLILLWSASEAEEWQNAVAFPPLS
jgi:hypothetical protein